MQQQIGSPIEEIRLAWVELGRSLVLVNSVERIAQLFFDVSQQVMKFGLLQSGSVRRDQKRLSVGASAFVLTRVDASQREFVSVFVVGGIELRSPFEIRNRFPRLPVVN